MTRSRASAKQAGTRFERQIADALAEVFGKRGAKGYRAITATSAQSSTSARDEADSDHADDPGA
jgi:hypothetical protein